MTLPGLPGLPPVGLPNLPAIGADLGLALTGGLSGGLGLPPISLPNLGSLGVELSAALNGLSASLNAMLSGSLNVGANLSGLIQTGETLAAHFGAGLGNLAANIGAGLNAAIQTGETLAANFIAASPTLSLPSLMLSIDAALSGGQPRWCAERPATGRRGPGGWPYRRPRGSGHFRRSSRGQRGRRPGGAGADRWSAGDNLGQHPPRRWRTRSPAVWPGASGSRSPGCSKPVSCLQ